MLNETPELLAFERRDAREVGATRSYQDALAIYAVLWERACRLNPDFPADWRDDMGPDLEIARVLNALPGGGETPQE